MIDVVHSQLLKVAAPLGQVDAEVLDELGAEIVEPGGAAYIDNSHVQSVAYTQIDVYISANKISNRY